MKLILSIFIILGLQTSAFATPFIGEPIIYHYDGSHDYNAVVTKVNSATEVNLIAFSWVDTIWGNSVSASTFVLGFVGVEHGTSNNRWEENPDAVGPPGDTGATGATGATGSAGPGSVVTATTTPSRSLNGAAWQASSTKDTELTYTFKIESTVSLAVPGSGGTVHLFCDTNTNPTTEVAAVSEAFTGTLTVGLTLVHSNILVLRYRQPTSHFCKLTSTNDTGTPTFTFARQVEQTL